MKKSCWFLIIATLLVACKKEDAAPPYKNAELDIETRISDLMSRMTLEEKVKQMDMYSSYDLITNGRLSVEKMDKHLNNTGIGSIHDFYPESAEAANEIQKYIIENTRLDIAWILW